MKILKDGGLEDDIMLSFRYFFENEEIFKIISNELKKLNIPFEIHEPSKRIKTFRLIIDEIHEEFFKPNAISEINSKFNVSNSNYDFFLGITSRFEIGGFLIPQNVIDAICILGGKVEISYAIS